MLIISVLMEIIALLTFSLTVHRNGDAITLRYPEADKLRWVEVCVESEGKYADRSEWYDLSCWEPRFVTEERRLKDGALHVRATLEITEDGHHSKLRTPVMQVRPETGE